MTGLGVISSVGCGSDSFFQSCVDGKSGIARLPATWDEYPCKVSGAREAPWCWGCHSAHNTLIGNIHPCMASDRERVLLHSVAMLRPGYSLTRRPQTQKSGPSTQIGALVTEGSGWNGPEEYMDAKDVKRQGRYTQFAMAAAKMAVSDAKLDVTKISDKER